MAANQVFQVQVWIGYSGEWAVLDEYECLADATARLLGCVVEHPSWLRIVDGVGDILVTDAWEMVDAEPTADVPNPVVAARIALDGGIARLYEDGTVDATDGQVYSLSPGFGSYEELSAWIAAEGKTLMSR